MADLYSACWDFGRMQLGAVSGANGATFGGGTLTGTVGFTTGMYTHGDVVTSAGQTIDGVELAPFCFDFDAQVGGGAFNIGFAPSTNRYQLSSASSFSVTWNGALGTELRDILGFEANLSGTTSYISTKRPKYTIISVIAGQSKDSSTFEAPGMIDYVEASDGSAYSTQPDLIATYRDWSQVYETPTGPTDAAWSASPGVGGAPVRRTDVGSATKVWWTWEDFYKHVRATLPFTLVDRATSVAGEGKFYKMRDATATWKPERVTPDFDGHWTMPFTTRFLDTTVER